MAKRATYITHPQRIYDDPLRPQKSDYVVVIPQTTSDAVVVEGTNESLTDRLIELGQGNLAVRNSIVSGEDIVKTSGSNVSVGNLIATVAQGFSEKGNGVDIILTQKEYVTLPKPGISDNYLILKDDKTFEYSQYFYGGRDFPSSPVEGQIYFHDQLQQSYKYTNAQWAPYPCVAIAHFDAGQLDKIYPYNTWWWDEVVWEETESDIPAGMEVSIYHDEPNNQDYLKVNKGCVVDSGSFFTLDTAIYKKVDASWERGSTKGSGDGSYSNLVANIIPEDITPENTQGFTFSTGSGSSTLLGSFNSALGAGWVAKNCPVSFMVEFPTGTSKSINKYSIAVQTGGLDFAPKSWNLLGSNDGSTWELIHSVRGAGFSGNLLELSFQPTNVKLYTHIKLVVLESVNSNSITKFGTIKFYSSIPELGVFVITDGETTDVLTSIYDGPSLPNGYINYHRIGTICVDSTGTLFGNYPKVTFSKDIAANYRTVRESLDKKADSSLDNISSRAISYIGSLVSLDYERRVTRSINAVYRADFAGVIKFVNFQGGEATIYASPDRNLVATKNQYCLQEINNSSNKYCLTVSVDKGDYYAVYSNATDTKCVFILVKGSGI